MKVSPAQYIGGDFSIDPQRLVPSNEADGWLSKSLHAADLRFATGRYAMLAAIRSLYEDGFEILLPDYLCEAQVHILKANKVPFEFYRLNDELEPDLGGLQKWRARRAAMLVINYFGLLDLDAIGDALKMQFPQFEFIADCVQSPMNLPRRSVYQYAFTSLRKFLPVPDGCELYGQPRHLMTGPFSRSAFTSQKVTAAIEKHRYLVGNQYDPACENAFLGQFQNAERTLDDSPDFVAASDTSKEILRHIRRDEVAKRRRENYLFLANALSALEIVPTDLRADQVPLCLPMTATNRDRLRSELSSYGIFTPVHWPAFADLPENAMGRKLAREQIGFVIDQRYDVTDMQRQADALREILARCSDIKIRRLL